MDAPEVDGTGIFCTAVAVVTGKRYDFAPSGSAGVQTTLVARVAVRVFFATDVQRGAFPRFGHAVVAGAVIAVVAFLLLVTALARLQITGGVDAQIAVRERAIVGRLASLAPGHRDVAAAILRVAEILGAVVAVLAIEVGVHANAASQVARVFGADVAVVALGEAGAGTHAVGGLIETTPHKRLAPILGATVTVGAGYLFVDALVGPGVTNIDGAGIFVGALLDGKTAIALMDTIPGGRIAVVGGAGHLVVAELHFERACTRGDVANKAGAKVRRPGAIRIAEAGFTVVFSKADTLSLDAKVLGALVTVVAIAGAPALSPPWWRGCVVFALVLWAVPGRRAAVGAAGSPGVVVSRGISNTPRPVAAGTRLAVLDGPAFGVGDVGTRTSYCVRRGPGSTGAVGP